MTESDAGSDNAIARAFSTVFTSKRRLGVDGLSELYLRRAVIAAIFGGLAIWAALTVQTDDDEDPERRAASEMWADVNLVTGGLDFACAALFVWVAKAPTSSKPTAALACMGGFGLRSAYFVLAQLVRLGKSGGEMSTLLVIVLIVQLIFTAVFMHFVVTGWQRFKRLISAAEGVGSAAAASAPILPA